MIWTEAKKAEIRGHWDAGLSKKEIMLIMDLTEGQFEGARMRCNLLGKTGKPHILRADHPALTERRSVFKRRSELSLPVLKSGRDMSKLGHRITKGRWKGIPLYSLTLEERATCPPTCSHWRSCYGNRMRWSARQPHGMMLQAQIALELSNLQVRHPDGFVVRLHILGDFYSLRYVEFWALSLVKYPALHVFGFTSWRWDSSIGKALHQLNFLERWWVRFSDGPVGFLRTANDGITCPAQTGGTNSCSTCGLCWTTMKPIRFLLH